MSKKKELQKLFYHITDHLGDLWEQQGKVSEISFNLTPLLNPQNQSENLILPVKTVPGQGGLLFSNSMEELIPNLHFFKHQEVVPLLLNYPKDYSPRLNLRRNFLSFCLYEGESYFLTLKIGTLPLSGYFKHLNYCHPQQVSLFITEVPFNELQKTLSQTQELILTINTTPKNSNTKLRELINEELSLEKTLLECQNLYLQLINFPSYIQNNFEFFQNILLKFQLINTPAASPEDLLKQVSYLSLSSFNHLDFFDWEELFISFSIKDDFTSRTHVLRLLAQSQLSLYLANPPTWPLGLKRSI